jgi:hypothetical protein
VALLTSIVLLCKVQCMNLYNIEVIISALMCSMEVIFKKKKKKKKKKTAVRYMNSDDIEVELVVLSGDWRFSLSSFIFHLSLSKGGALHYTIRTVIVVIKYGY